MANYYEWCVLMARNPELIGEGLGTTPRGEKVICVSIQGRPINRNLPQSAKDLNWMALTEECARSLFRTLYFALTGDLIDPHWKERNQKIILSKKTTKATSKALGRGIIRRGNPPDASMNEGR
jgi:hypothetical protein